jgi:TolB protein
MDRNGEGELSVDQRFWDNWEPTFSPDGHRLAFVSSRENLGWEIYSMNIGESDINPRPLICENIPEDWLKWGPAWSPTDEERIAFVVQSGTDLDAERQTDIWVMDDEGANCQQLTEGDASNLGPTWSPDGRQIAFLSDRNGNFEVYIMDRNGRNPHNVTNTPDFDETYVAWSPDGNWLAFTRDIGANDEVFVMTIDGEHVTNITQNSAADWGPVWLP